MLHVQFIHNNDIWSADLPVWNKAACKANIIISSLRFLLYRFPEEKQGISGQEMSDISGKKGAKRIDRYTVLLDTLDGRK